MLGKLSLRNAKRQAKDYIIYILTMVVSIALLFSFNSLVFSEDIMELSSSMKEFKTSIIVVSIFVVFIMGWLMNYIMKLMLEKRSKEFGTYSILGIEKKHIANLYIVENVIIGIIAMIVGVLVGILLYQCFTAMIMNIFEQPYQVNITVKVEAIGLTFVYFVAMFVLALLRSRRKIRKAKAIDLLEAEKKNENKQVKQTKTKVILFVVSLVCFAISMLFLRHGIKDIQMIGRDIFFSLLFCIVGIYLFYRSLASFLVFFFLKQKKRKYKGQNLFLYRNLSSKINTMSGTMGTIALLFTIAIVAINIGLSMEEMLKKEENIRCPFEIQMSANEWQSEEIKDMIRNKEGFRELFEYQVYATDPEDAEKIREDLKESPFAKNIGVDKEDLVIKQSDYQKLREMLGYEKVAPLKEGEAIIQCVDTAKPYFKQGSSFSLKGKNFIQKEINVEGMGQLRFEWICILSCCTR